MKIDKDVMDVLIKSTCDKNYLYLPNTQLDRNLYVKVNKILESLGGKWNRKSKAHVFDMGFDVGENLDDLINTGEWVDKKKVFQFFETPEALAEELVEWAEIKDYHKALEPSGGKGRIVDALLKKTNYVNIVELDPENAEYLSEKYVGKLNIWNKDFLEICDEKDFPQEYDRIVMNPPFSGGQDVKHIFQAWDLLAKGGILTSVVSESPFFRENRLSQSFRQWLEENNVQVKNVEAGAFRESGTMVKTRIIKVIKS